MSGFEWLRPIGLDVTAWVTQRDCRTVLVVVQNIASGWHLMDVARLVGSDPRVRVAFTATPEDGADRSLREIGAVLVPWREARAHEFGLAIAASAEPASRVRAPLAVLPYRGREDEYAELAPPALVLLAHVGDRAGVRTAAVVGDSSHDRLVASRALRPFYRRALGVGPRQRLLVVGIWPGQWTWGHEVLSRALRELPPDEYRILAVPQPHPYAGTGYGGLAGLLRNGGLSLMPPESDWRAALVAADWIIDDHGILATYGTVTGTPILLSEGYGSPGGIAELAPPLSPRRGLRAQLREATRSYAPERYASVLARITSEPGRFNRNARRALYRLLRMSQPATIPTADPVSPPFRIE